MGAETSIEWTDATWNPIRGCSRVSPGCEHCYAETMAGRFSGEGQPYEGLVKLNGGRGAGKRARWTGVVRMVPEHLADPLRWQKPRRIFVDSMSDLFHENLSVEDIARVWAVMLLAPRHTFQILTKRADRMRAVLSDGGFYRRVLDAAGELRADRPELMQVGISDPSRFPARWVWLGVSVEDQLRGDERIPLLLETPAAVRFLSVEPMLGPVELDPWLKVHKHWRSEHSLKEPPRHPPYPLHWYEPQALVAAEWRCPIDWVIVGAESGPGWRPMQEAWVRSLRDQCEAAKVPLFYKQMGDGRGGKIKLPVLDGRQHVEWPPTAGG